MCVSDRLWQSANTTCDHSAQPMEINARTGILSVSSVLCVRLCFLLRHSTVHASKLDPFSAIDSVGILSVCFLFFDCYMRPVVSVLCLRLSSHVSD